jgi:hypothetical protein
MKKNIKTKARLYQYGFKQSRETFCDSFDSLIAFFYSQFPPYYCDRIINYQLKGSILEIQYEEENSLDKLGYLSIRLRVL